jgi:hypothetical protein
MMEMMIVMMIMMMMHAMVIVDDDSDDDAVMEAVAAHNPNLGDGDSESSSTGDLGDGGVLRQRHQARHEGNLLHHGVREMLLHMRPVLVV